MKTKTLARPFQIKSLEDDGSFSGYGSVFGVVDAYSDVVEKGAFAASLDAWGEKNKLPALLWQHKHDEPIGIYTSMKEDDHGLYVEGRLLIDADPMAKRAHAHLKAGSISGMSIGYSLPSGGWEYDKDKGIYRLKQIDLWEVSLVTFPANEDATVSTVKSALGNKTEFERFLRDAGLSRTQAKGLMARGFEGLSQRDAVDSDLLHSLKTITHQLQGN